MYFFFKYFFIVWAAAYCFHRSTYVDAHIIIAEGAQARVLIYTRSARGKIRRHKNENTFLALFLE